MRKKITCLLLAAALSIGLGTAVYADEFTGSSSWAVEFDGKKMNSNFKSSEMAEEIYQLQPGDTIRLQVTLKNSGTKETDWYMTNEVLKSLEESQSVAEGGAYTYILTYTDDKKQETVLYTSESVGGEGDSKAGTGLNQATDSLDEYFYLDRLASGSKGTVYLTVGLDGETQGNEYQDTLAQLQMNFAVEEVGPGTPGREGAVPGSPQQPGASGRSLPRTGDETDIIPYCIGALLSGIILLAFGLMALRNNQEGRGAKA
jgi:hypothetical protein